MTAEEWASVRVGSLIMYQNDPSKPALGVVVGEGESEWIVHWFDDNEVTPESRKFGSIIYMYYHLVSR